MSERLEALRASVSHLRDVVAQLESHHHVAPAYPSEWTIAATLSHVGSGAVILRQMFLAALSGESTPAGFNQSVWDAWNAKAPAEQIADALRADQELLDAFDATDPLERASFATDFGPLRLDFDAFVGLRLGEHVLHTWDVEVVLTPGAELATPAAGLLLDQLAFVAARSGRPTGEPRTVAVRTYAPARDYDVVIDETSVELRDAVHEGEVDLKLPAEAFVRLVYGRLDAHAGLDDGAEAHLEGLRRAFPGL